MDGTVIESRYGARFFATVQTGPEPPVKLALFLFLGLKWPGRSIGHPTHLTTLLMKDYS
jgi:hypothetical protein